MPSLPPRWPTVLLLACLVAALVGLVPARRAEAGPAWERAIREGIATQDRDIARTSAKAVLRRLESAASREADVPTLYLLARAYAKSGDNPSAIAAYGDVIGREPGCWFAWRDRGVLRLLGKDTAGGEADLRRAVQAKPDFVDALQPLGALLLEARRFEEGIAYLQRAVEAAPDLDSARFQIVEGWLLAGRPEDAMRALDPLLARAPADPGLRHAKGRVLAARQDFAGARAVYKQLATEYPDKPAPLRSWLAVAAQEKQIDPEEAVWALERLRRLSGDAQEKKKLTEEIDRIRKGMAGAAKPQGPPTPEVLARLLRDADPKTRRAGLLYVIQAAPETTVIAGDLLVALVERLDPAREPDPGVRGLALAIFERSNEASIAPLVRASLRDPDSDVRCKTSDVLRATRNPMAIAALARHATGADAALATSARQAIYDLAGAAPPAADETPQAQAAAFSAWWAGPAGRDAKLRALAAVPEAADLAPDELAFPFALDPDPAVWPAAYAALRALLPKAQGASARAAWMRTLPLLDAPALAPEGREAFLEAMLSWWEKRPR